ncbi:hypothetical protein K438DRAFT_1952511 [Mycena galopus ATCC 62051]|nr:hypothetical protein K438DRAFT_1952511 [Mycena galopus ATCC 62051]
MEQLSHFEANTTIGAYQIGVLVSYVLLGVTTMQTHIYYGRFPTDAWKFKALVAFVWICEVGHAVCLGHSLYIYTISDFAQPELLFGPISKSFVASVVLSGVIGTCVQWFFGFRIYTLCKKWYIPALIFVMGFLRTLGCVVMFVAGLRMTPLAAYIAQWEWLATSIWSISTANDLTITATMVFLLHRQRHKVQKKTAALVDKLILWSLETGFLTSVAGVVSLVFFVTMKENFIWTAFFSVASRLFSNSLLASLNSRTALRSLNEGSVPFSPPSSGLRSTEIEMSKRAPITYTYDSKPSQTDELAYENV